MTGFLNSLLAGFAGSSMSLVVGYLLFVFKFRKVTGKEHLGAVRISASRLMSSIIKMDILYQHIYHSSEKENQDSYINSLRELSCEFYYFQFLLADKTGKDSAIINLLQDIINKLSDASRLTIEKRVAFLNESMQKKYDDLGTLISDHISDLKNSI
jgi:hypothetical protein